MDEITKRNLFRKLSGLENFILLNSVFTNAVTWAFLIYIAFKK